MLSAQADGVASSTRLFWIEGEASRTLLALVVGVSASPRSVCYLLIGRAVGLRYMGRFNGHIMFGGYVHDGTSSITPQSG